MPETITRPNGKPYRPRKVTAYPIGDENGCAEGVVVLGTHDYDRAKPLADQVVRREVGAGYTAVTWETGWYRDGFTGGERRWVADEVNGRAGVLFREIVETGHG